MRVDVSKLQFDDDIIKYLILPFWHTKEHDLADYLEIKQDPEFEGFVMKQVETYLSGKRPDETMLGAVMNVADQYVAGGEIVLRAGDYIAFQRQYREVTGKRS